MRPDENRLGALIGAAFERLPEPEAARLEALEARLLPRAARRFGARALRPLFWWLFLGLAATGAAAWWAGEYFSESSPKRAIERIVPAMPEKVEAEKAPDPVIERRRESPASGSAESLKESPTIYRRETY